MADLIGRTRELRDLQQAWEAAQRAEPQLVVLWGRRRVGKTFLLVPTTDPERLPLGHAHRAPIDERLSGAPQVTPGALAILSRKTRPV